jgi:hypothetical protein
VLVWDRVGGGWADDERTGVTAPPASPGPVAQRGPDAWLRAAAIGGSVLLWSVACGLPALHVRLIQPDPWDRSGTVDSGLICALYGPLGPLYRQFAWYANPALAVALCLFGARKWRAATLTAAAGLVIALDALALLPWMPERARDYFFVSRLLPGFYVWLASIGLVVVAGAAALLGQARAASARVAAPTSPTSPRYRG